MKKVIIFGNENNNQLNEFVSFVKEQQSQKFQIQINTSLASFDFKHQERCWYLLFADAKCDFSQVTQKYQPSIADMQKLIVVTSERQLDPELVQLVTSRVVFDVWNVGSSGPLLLNKLEILYCSEEQLPLENKDFFLETSDPTRIFDEKAYREAVGKYGAQLASWEFDLTKCTEDDLEWLSIYMLEKYSFFDLWKVDRNHFKHLVHALRTNYRRVPYHNWQHAFDVTQGCFVFINTPEIAQLLTEVEFVSILIGALCHDVDHPGLNNGYHVSSKAPLALLYNDNSVLENHHLYMAFSLMQRLRIFENTPTDKYMALRKCVIGCVLQTDMMFHFELVGKFNKKVDEGGFNVTEPSDRQLLSNMILHCCDISNPARPWPLTTTWAHRVQEEFWHQGDLEKTLLKFTNTTMPTMDRTTPNTPAMLVGFGGFVVLPTVRALERVGGGFVVKMRELLEENTKKWEVLKKEIEDEKKRKEEKV